LKRYRYVKDAIRNYLFVSSEETLFDCAIMEPRIDGLWLACKRYFLHQRMGKVMDRL